MHAICSVFDRRWRAPCALVLMALCCQAHAEDSAAGTAPSPGPAQATPGLGFVAPESVQGQHCQVGAVCAAGEQPQSSYLLGFKKFFDAERLFSRLGLFGHGAARPESRDSLGAQSEEADADRPSRHGPGLNLHPLSASAIEARFGGSGLTYIARDEVPLQAGLKTRGVKYSLYVDDCARLEGLYGRASGQGRYGLGFAQDNWSVALASGAGDAHMSLHVGYAIPLGQSGGGGGTCSVASSAGSRSLSPGAWLTQ